MPELLGAAVPTTSDTDNLVVDVGDRAVNDRFRQAHGVEVRNLWTDAQELAAHRSVGAQAMGY